MKHFLFVMFAFLQTSWMMQAYANPSVDSQSHGQISTQSFSAFKNVGDKAQANQERTLSILKPDAVKKQHIGDIIARFEQHGLRVIGIKMVKLSQEEAAQFYQVHQGRPFFKDLTQFMASGPIVVLVLEGDRAIDKNRQLMGATDPRQAGKGTIRADFAASVTQNAVHGSDSPQTARQEIAFFFKPNEIYPTD